MIGDTNKEGTRVTRVSQTVYKNCFKNNWYKENCQKEQNKNFLNLNSYLVQTKDKKKALDKNS